MDYKHILRAILENAYKLPAQEIDSLLDESKEDQAALTALLAKDQERITSIKQPLIGKFDEGRNAGFKKAMTDLEKSIKEKYGIDSDLQGVELIDHVVAEKAKPNTKDLTDDVIKVHPAYQKLERDAKATAKKVADDWETKFNQREAEIQENEVFSAVVNKAKEVRNKLNPIIPKNPEVAATIEETFVNKLKGYKYKKNDDGSFTALDKDGKPVDDGHGYTLDLDKLVTGIAGKVYEFASNNGGSNAGNGAAGGQNNNQNNGSSGTNRKPKDMKEFTAVMNDTTIPAAERIEISKQWDAEHTE